MKNLTLTPFTFKLSDQAENLREQGSEKWLVSLRNRSEKWLVSLRNGSEKWLVSLRNKAKHGKNSVIETDKPFLKSIT